MNWLRLGEREWVRGVRRVVDYSTLWGHTRDVYQLPGVADTVNLGHIKEQYYTTLRHVNPKQLVAAGPGLDFSAPHGREDLSGGPPAGLD